MEISILTNDEAKPGFLFEHGLSIKIKHQNANILFDTGFTDVYLNNARKLGIHFLDTDYIVLSHGHYDHTGGLRYFISISNVKKIIIHKDAFIPKYAKETFLRFNGMPFHQDDLSWAYKLFHKVEGLHKIEESIYVLGNIPNGSPSSKYFANQTIDDFHDEIILILEESDGLSLFLGCSHFGISEGIEAVKEVFPDSKIKNVIAGMHMSSSTDAEIQEVTSYFRSLDFEKLIPLHCTGKKTMKALKELFKERCHLLKAGDTLQI